MAGTRFKPMAFTQTAVGDTIFAPVEFPRTKDAKTRPGTVSGRNCGIPALFRKASSHADPRGHRTPHTDWSGKRALRVTATGPKAAGLVLDEPLAIALVLDADQGRPRTQIVGNHGWRVGKA